MKAVLCFVFVVLSFQAIPAVFSREIATVPDKTNFVCIPDGESEHLPEYNKLEVVNNLNKHDLIDLINERGKMPEDNPLYNKFIYCVWRKNMFLHSNDEVNYNNLEKIITQAIVGVVGSSGPAIKLSMIEAKKIVDECRKIKELNAEIKVAKMQNIIVESLKPFANI